jgi:superfamily II RNA helicase
MNPANFRPFQLDDFQKRAIEAVNKDKSILVSAPTGAGKTVIAEYVIEKCLTEDKGVIYTAPVKALSNQKFREFQVLFPDRVGIITGDVSINPYAPLLIMTTEIFRNRILEHPESFVNHSWIIFDEIHYLDDAERGTVWEESLIFMPGHMKVVGLSATIPNIDQFAHWLRSIHENPIKVIKEEKRPVPLHFFFLCYGKIYHDLNVIKKIAYGRRRRRIYQEKRANYGESTKQMNNPMILVRHFIKARRLPCIYFSFSRKRCEYLAERAKLLTSLTEWEREKLLLLYDRLCFDYNIAKDERTINMRDLVEHGVAYHHAGLHPMLKEVIEQLFTNKVIQIIFTTETFALGINMPAKAVVVDELKKKYGRFHRVVKVRDFFQMAGRAGRRGIDKEGYVYSRLNPSEVNFEQLKHIFNVQPEPIKSSFNVSYASMLNLYEIYGERLLDVYSKSFHYFLVKNKNNLGQLTMMKAKLRILNNLEYIKENKLTEKAHFAKNIHGYDLPLAELYNLGILEELSPEQLAILCLAAVFEPRPKSKGRTRFNKDIRFLRKVTLQVMDAIHHIEKRNGIYPLSKKFFYDISVSLINWMNGLSFNKVMEELDIDEGEVIRYFRMSIQILREMLETPVSKSLREKIKAALVSINKGVINAEEQLRTFVAYESEFITE